MRTGKVSPGCALVKSSASIHYDTGNYEISHFDLKEMDKTHKERKVKNKDRKNRKKQNKNRIGRKGNGIKIKIEFLTFLSLSEHGIGDSEGRSCS